MRLKGLLEPFENSVEFESIIADINNEKYPIGMLFEDVVLISKLILKANKIVKINKSKNK